MRRPLIAALALAALGFPAGAAAQTPPPPEEPRIPPGAKAQGVDVGNLTLAEAAALLDTTFGPKFSQPMELRVAGKRFRLRMKQIDFRFEALRTARRAMAAANRVTPQPDGSRPVDVALITRYSARKLAARVAAIDAATTLAPRDATVRITLRHMRVRKSTAGASLAPKPFAKRIATALSKSGGARILRGHRIKLKPKVTVRDLKRGRYGTVITIDQSNFKLRLFKRLKFSKSYGVAVGQPAYPTPNGLFSITNKAVNPAWSAPDRPWAGAYRNETVPGGSAENPLKARWMGIVNGVGIHGTGDPGSIGTRASHGCIRMTVPDVIALYPRVPVGSPVLIG